VEDGTPQVWGKICAGGGLQMWIHGKSQKIGGGTTWKCYSEGVQGEGGGGKERGETSESLQLECQGGGGKTVSECLPGRGIDLVSDYAVYTLFQGGVDSPFGSPRERRVGGSGRRKEIRD